MQLSQQIFFILLFAFAVWLFTRSVRRIRRNILLGRDEDHSDRPGERWKNVLLLAFGQTRMFRKPMVAVLHFFIYAGFIIINIEILEIILDGILGTHRLFARPLGGLYKVLIDSFEVLAVLVLVACIVFLFRRNVVRVWRFRHRELDGWPRKDANYILITEIALMTLFLTMNAADRALQLKGHLHYPDTGDFWVSGLIAPAFFNLSESSLVLIERLAWWLHITGILAFLNYLIFSKHLHILLAFPNAYYARLDPKGEMKNMPAVQQEVLYAMQPELVPAEATPPPRFGAKDVFDLTWRNLLDAYSCTECGRCTAACPANITGKKLSPRKIMMDTRDRMEEVGRNIDKHGSFADDSKNLLSYISVEELRACTACQACVEECPVAISPLEIILELRRSLVMEDSNAPQEWHAMFSNVENNFAPWKFSPEDRDKWVTEMANR
ncbi:MAG TPA: (Fe-S)-binding protein [Chitinophagaceae bacterium]|nr:(Fe-S)-binding protein [Chitinophagaceae bacterium]